MPAFYKQKQCCCSNRSSYLLHRCSSSFLCGHRFTIWQKWQWRKSCYTLHIAPLCDWMNNDPLCHSIIEVFQQTLPCPEHDLKLPTPSDFSTASRRWSPFAVDAPWNNQLLTYLPADASIDRSHRLVAVRPLLLYKNHNKCACFVMARKFHFENSASTSFF